MSKKRKTKACSCCEERAIKRVDVQTSWFRGEDDVFNLCPEHLVMYRRSQLEAIYAAAALTNARRRARAAK